MSKKTGQTPTARRPTLKMLLALASFVADVLAKLSFEQVQNLLTHKDTILKKKLQEVFRVTLDSVAGEFVGVRAEWEKFYKDHFSFIVDLSEVRIPEKPMGDWRLLFIPVGLTMNSVLEIMRAKFHTLSYDDCLDTRAIVNTRTSAQSYSVWVRNGVEPDEKYLGKSMLLADPNGKIGMTLLERMIYEVKYFIETGKHLDEEGITICTGSRNSDGDIPDVCFDLSTDGVDVGLSEVDRYFIKDGIREVVS